MLRCLKEIPPSAPALKHLIFQHRPASDSALSRPPFFKTPHCTTAPALRRTAVGGKLQQIVYGPGSLSRLQIANIDQAISVIYKHAPVTLVLKYENDIYAYRYANHLRAMQNVQICLPLDWSLQGLDNQSCTRQQIRISARSSVICLEHVQWIRDGRVPKKTGHFTKF